MKKSFTDVLENPMPYIAILFTGLVLSAAIPNKDNSEQITQIIREQDKLEMELESERIQALMESETDYFSTMQETEEIETIALHVKPLIPCHTHGIDYITEYEFDLLCRVVMSEASIEPIETQIAVAETILNRLSMGGYGNSINEVVHQEYQYSLADNGEPNESVLQAVTNALEEQIYPSDMVYFRTGHYHDFGTPYKKIGSTYFSLK